MPAINIQWVSRQDSAVCPVCRELNALAHWTFTGEEGVPDELEWNGRIVWDKLHRSDAHGHHRGTPKCRCHLEHKLDVSDLQKRLSNKLEEVKAARGIGQP